MRDLAFLICWFLFVGLLMLSLTSVLWFTKVAAFLMRSFRIYAFPTAIRIALSMETESDEWFICDDEVNKGNLRVRYDQGESSKTRVYGPDTNQHRGLMWKPNPIERRIIHDAIMQLRWRRTYAALDDKLPKLP